MTFKERLASGALTIDTWIKTPDPTIVEVLGHTDLDCLVLDAEHAPFDRRQIDVCLQAAQHSKKPVLVRVAAARAEYALQALDCGATGILVPHVRSADQAETILRMCHYGPGGRGYAGSSRAAGFTRKSMSDHLANSAARTTVILQIEDPEAIEDIDAIAQVDGVDALFVGRIDLSVAMGKSPDDPQVVQAVEQVCAAAKRHGRTVGMFLNRVADVPEWRDRGASLFLLGSDHTFLMSGAAQLSEAARR